MDSLASGHNSMGAEFSSAFLALMFFVFFNVTLSELSNMSV